jgi:hypothetical protein
MSLFDLLYDISLFFTGIQPSPYCVYKFYDFGDHDTNIVHNSNEPVFNDAKTFTVPMTEELDSYLRTKVSKTMVRETWYKRVVIIVVLVNWSSVRGGRSCSFVTKE